MKKTWWKEAVVYQIYPRSFNDSNGDGIGDIKGITEKLDYLKLLGIDVIWLSPVYSSPNEDNGYDISDYRNIMTDFGTMADFDEMLAEAHKRGIKIIMDLVVNHTSDKHAWFIESQKSMDNAYRDYYIWKEPQADGSAPNNWGACFGGSVWKYDEKTNMYYLHLFTEQQPDLNWENQTVRDEVFDMMTWWCEKGIDGFRMDVISMISKDQRYADGKIQKDGYGDFAPHAINGPRVHEYLKEMNERVLSKYDLLTVGETAGVTIEEAKKYAGENENELNMVFQFEHVEGDGVIGKWTDKKRPLVELKEILSKWQTELEGSAWNSLYWSNHDQPRAVSRFGDDSEEYRVISAKMLGTCLHMMHGTPYIYQGEELGMTNYPFTELSQFQDVESINRFKELTEDGIVDEETMMRYLQFKGRDNSRTPMQWDDTKNAGFTTGEPWIAVNPNYQEINAEKEVAKPDSIFHYYRQLIALRKQYDVICEGVYELLLPDDEKIFAFKRKSEQEELLVLCNFSADTVAISADISEQTKDMQCIITNYEEQLAGAITQLRAYEGIVLYQRKEK